MKLIDKDALVAKMMKDPYGECVQYNSIEAGIQRYAGTYSFNIESKLFNQLTKEQQGLWRKEIEQAYIIGGETGVELARDPRYKENLEVKEAQEEPISEDLEEAAFDYAEACKYEGGEKLLCVEHFKASAKWQKENLWKPADGDDLPEIDREVIALLDNGKVVFAHRPPEYWDGKNIATGKVTRNYPKTYDKGGWNLPDVKYWLDVKLPDE